MTAFLFFLMVGLLIVLMTVGFAYLERGLQRRRDMWDKFDKEQSDKDSK